jgi:hypothetical protein
MKRKQILAISLIAVAGLIYYFSRQRRTRFVNKLKAEEVSEHGYETAHDILFPRKKKRVKRY